MMLLLLLLALTVGASAKKVKKTKVIKTLKPSRYPTSFPIASPTTPPVCLVDTTLCYTYKQCCNNTCLSLGGGPYLCQAWPGGIYDT